MDAANSKILAPEEQRMIDEEEALLSTARAAIRSAGGGDRAQRTDSQISSLRGAVGRAMSDDMASIAAEAQRVRETARVQGGSHLPDPQLPYFAHMQLESNGRVRDIMLGQTTLIDSKHEVNVVDWREAPIAQIFFHYAEGEDYEQETPDRTIEGTLTKRRILAFDHGELVQIQTADQTLRRNRAGDWSRDDDTVRPSLAGGEGGLLAKRIIGTGQSGEKMPVISSLLDEQQYEALTHDPEQPLLILGGAGCGKTTVALHRLAHLAYGEPETYSAKRLLVIVPEEGLVRLTRALLAELAMEGVGVTTVDDWFAAQGAALFPELPTKLALTTLPQVMRLKRHPAFCALLPSIALEMGRVCAVAIDRSLKAENTFETLYANSDAAFPLSRLKAALEQVEMTKSLPDLDEVRRVVGHETKMFLNASKDREKLFGDRDLLEKVVKNAAGELPQGAIDKTILRYRLQDSPTSEEEFADVDVMLKTATDGRALDDGTPMEDAGSIDVEDFALLIELFRAKTGHAVAKGRKRASYAHMLLDEAQELSRVELMVLGQTVTTVGSVTVAGDAAQQISAGNEFLGWDSVMDSLGHGRAAPVTLTTSYRCTQPIVKFAHQVLGPLAPANLPSMAKAGSEVSLSRVPSEMHTALLLGDALNDLIDREPKAQVAIITREDRTARRLYGALHNQLPVRFVEGGQFSFKPGIDITTVQQVKGLEFDYVVIPDASDEVYPDDPASRRMLHVAATRAIHQLWVLTEGRWSQIVPNDLTDTPR